MDVDGRVHMLDRKPHLPSASKKWADPMFEVSQSKSLGHGHSAVEKKPVDQAAGWFVKRLDDPM